MLTTLSTGAICRETDRRHQHAADCKKSPADCKMCRANMEWFGGLTGAQLSVALSEYYYDGRRKY